MTITRRHFIQGAAAAALLSTTGMALAADTIKIGYVSPQTGPLAPFGEADKWVIEQMRASFKDGVTIGGKKYAVEILLKIRVSKKSGTVLCSQFSSTLKTSSS